MAYSNDRESKTATIAVSDDTSDAVDLGGLTVVGLVLPSAFDTNTARLVPLVSADGTNYAALYKADGTLVTATVAATNTYQRIADSAWPALFVPWVSVKWQTLQSDESTAVTQTTARSIDVRCAKLTG